MTTPLPPRVIDEVLETVIDQLIDAGEPFTTEDVRERIFTAFSRSAIRRKLLQLRQHTGRVAISRVEDSPLPGRQVVVWQAVS